MGSVVVPDVRIGEWALVGAGGVVVRDLPAGCKALGVPARPI
jgi:acetyltransferase-like isoleucine patch superfamily enzyme